MKIRVVVFEFNAYMTDEAGGVWLDGRDIGVHIYQTCWVLTSVIIYPVPFLSSYKVRVSLYVPRFKQPPGAIFLK